MSNRTHVIDGVTYVEVARKAELDNKIVIVDAQDTLSKYKNGDILTVSNPDRWSALYPGDGISVKEHGMGVYHNEYRVLEPLESEEVTVDTSQANPQVIDMLANLARRVTSLEAQLLDTQRNVETWAELTATNEQDIAMLDNRTYSLTAVQSAEGILNEIERLLKRRGDRQ